MLIFWGGAYHERPHFSRYESPQKLKIATSTQRLIRSLPIRGATSGRRFSPGSPLIMSKKVMHKSSPVPRSIIRMQRHWSWMRPGCGPSFQLVEFFYLGAKIFLENLVGGVEKAEFVSWMET